MDNLTFLGFLFGPIVMIAFLITLGILPRWIEKAKKIGLVWDDVHKWKKKDKVPGSGGITVLIGFVIATLIYVGIKIFVFGTEANLIEIFTILTTIILAAFVGFIDDIIGWKSGGLTKRSRLLMMIFIAIPLMVINAGESTMAGISLGLLYPLILVPLAIVGAGTTFNFLAGYNGLESSQGILVLSGLAIATFITGNLWLSLIAVTMIASLFALWLFNKYPAKVFVGDIMTYPVGAMIACLAILGNIEKIAIFFFIPYIIEVILKARGKFEKQSFSKVKKDGSLIPLYPKIYGLEHVAVRLLRAIKGKAYEWEVPIVIGLFQLIIIVMGIVWIL
jgi:UDP-N-acetylglucosamine--dolichyl-phosphate N-acetylglucosaminephosphotransferase